LNRNEEEMALGIVVVFKGLSFSCLNGIMYCLSAGVCDCGVFAAPMI